MAYTYADEYVDVDLYNHKQYLSILSMLKKDTRKIVLVQIDGPEDNDPIVETAQMMMRQENKEIVSEWLGTIAPGRGAVQYTFKSNAEFFAYLCTFEAFFLWEKHPIKPHMGYTQLQRTAFGIDDIAFLDEDDTILFYTVTHEGFAWMHSKYDSPILYFQK